MPFLFGRLYRRLGAGYFVLYLVFEVASALLVCLATVGIFALYTETSAAEFWRVVAVAEGAVAVALVYSAVRGWRLTRPIVAWTRAGGPEENALEVWRCAVGLPRRLVVANGWPPFAIVGVPVAIYSTLEFDLPAYSALIIFAGTMVAVAYAAILNFFASELFLRPVLEDIGERLPPDFGGAPLGVPLRWKLLGALPLINVITGVVASGLSTDGSASLEDLGLDVVVAVGVAFTISFELTLLLSRSVLRPVDDLLKATEAVKRGDLDARVPVVSGDELGALAGSFNEMMEGLSERERLRGAFGSYVDPEVAERVLEEGELLEGQEREVTVMFVTFGASSGHVVVGSVGGGGRLEFSVIGDAVNVAARVQALTREMGDVLLITEATLSAMKIRDSGVYARCEAELRGITEPVRLYSTDTALDERSTLRSKSLITDT